jgi:site-specific recombinase XerD
MHIKTDFRIHIKHHMYTKGKFRIHNNTNVYTFIRKYIHIVLNDIGIRTAQELLGHSSISTTERYAHLTGAHKQAAVIPTRHPEIWYN